MSNTRRHYQRLTQRNSRRNNPQDHTPPQTQNRRPFNRRIRQITYPHQTLISHQSIEDPFIDQTTASADQRTIQLRQQANADLAVANQQQLQTPTNPRYTVTYPPSGSSSTNNRLASLIPAARSRTSTSETPTRRRFSKTLV